MSTDGGIRAKESDRTVTPWHARSVETVLGELDASPEGTALVVVPLSVVPAAVGQAIRTWSRRGQASRVRAPRRGPQSTT